jgi:L-alanine-DL-glutamate epimerase-like enolase superfamily enzyme
MTTSPPGGITALDVRAYRVPTEQTETDGTYSWDATTVVVVRAHAHDHWGLGFSYAARASAVLVDELLSDVIVGRDPFDVPGAWLAMVQKIRNVGRPGIASMAIAAIDTALWDLKARLLDVSLARLLGLSRPAVPVYGSGGFTSYTDEQLVAQLGGWVHDGGIPRVKMKIGTDRGRCPDRDAHRIGLVRDAIGDDAELYVDANGAFTRKQAIRLGATLEDLGVTWFEEPVSSDDLAGLHEVRGAIAADVAAGEYGYDITYFERMCARGAVDVLQADVSRCAGITEWLRAAAVAAAHGLEISGHCAQSLHVAPACAVANLRHLEYFHDHARVDRLLFDDVLTPIRGQLHPNLDQPGIGLHLKEPDAEPYLVYATRVARDRDGGLQHA